MTKVVSEEAKELEERCGNCYYLWQYEEQYSFFQCRYDPPARITTIERPDVSGVFPSVPLHWWCGKYRPNVERQAEIDRRTREQREAWCEIHIRSLCRKRERDDARDKSQIL